MEFLVMLLLFLLSSTIAVSDGSWCVCRSDQPTSSLQKTIDFACGAGADCTSILANGACYNPDTVVSHCSWAANSYYQRKSSVGATCDFSGTAALSTTDPSYSGCTFPSSASAAGSSGAPISTGAPGSATTPPSTLTPGTGTGTTGTGTGTAGTGFGGLGPSGTSSMDGTGTAAGLLPSAELAFLAIILSFLAFA